MEWTLSNFMDKKIKKMMLSLFVTVCSLSFASCSDDKDDLSNGHLGGTSWEIISDSEDDELPGIVITFNKDGNCTFNPATDWTYAKWFQTDNTLKIVLGEGEPDDYMEGAFVVNGSNATYTYSWYDYNGKWGGEDSAVMTLKKK